MLWHPAVGHTSKLSMFVQSCLLLCSKGHMLLFCWQGSHWRLGTAWAPTACFQILGPQALQLCYYNCNPPAGLAAGADRAQPGRLLRAAGAEAARAVPQPALLGVRPARRLLHAAPGARHARLLHQRHRWQGGQALGHSNLLPALQVMLMWACCAGMRICTSALCNTGVHASYSRALCNLPEHMGVLAKDTLQTCRPDQGG